MSTGQNAPDYVVLVRKETGDSLENSCARTLDEARQHAEAILQSDPSAQRVMVLEGNSHTPLGSIDAGDGAWHPVESFPSRRMTWH